MTNFVIDYFHVQSNVRTFNSWSEPLRNCIANAVENRVKNSYTALRQGKNPVPILSHSVGQERRFLLTRNSVHCRAQVETIGKTGVEMEALTAVQVGLLTIYDMCKAVDRGMVMTNVRVLEKHGGKSGDWTAQY